MIMGCVLCGILAEQRELVFFFTFRLFDRLFFDGFFAPTQWFFVLSVYKIIEIFKLLISS